ncbi:MAG: NADH:flavin oxidoreductase [Deltaproteobacteria bacterium]|nr:NADH:flavin oxidoreductase [Deltaproteobacteria bacterium]
MADIFDSFELKHLKLPNRVVVAPMTRMQCGTEGIPTDAVIAYYRRFAEGGAGLIITEGVYTDTTASKGYFGEPGIVNGAQEAGWKKVADAVHSAGGLVGMQLFHTGRCSHSKIIGRTPLAPSAVPAKGMHASAGGPMEMPEAMTEAQIEESLQGFTDSSRKAKASGMDCVEIHGAHGYLIHQFYYSDSNTRTDRWGGMIENRIRFPVELVRRVRAAVGPDYPVLYRFSEFRVDDLKYSHPETLDIFRALVPALEKAGVDVFHVSTYDAFKPFHDTGKPLLAHVREMTKKPLVGVGKLGEDPARARELVRSGLAELAALGKPMLANADWANRVRTGQPLTPFEPMMMARL